jgi:TrmH family RNA methyltransferase
MTLWIVALKTDKKYASIHLMTNHLAAKLIKSLHEKKHRTLTKKFLVEGDKNVTELLESDFNVEVIYATEAFVKQYKDKAAAKNIKVQVVDASELSAFGTLERNDAALAIVWQKKEQELKLEGVTLALDEIRDPGNLGTLIRIADWYGVKNIVCSTSSVDFYNPKVINATMGSFARVKVHYADLAVFLKKHKTPVLGAFLDGESAHSYAFPKSGILVIGSESHGISKEVGRAVTTRITIPKFGKAESLNAAVAGGIILDRWVSSI